MADPTQVHESTTITFKDSHRRVLEFCGEGRIVGLIEIELVKLLEPDDHKCVGELIEAKLLRKHEAVEGVSRTPLGTMVMQSLKKRAF